MTKGLAGTWPSKSTNTGKMEGCDVNDVTAYMGQEEKAARTIQVRRVENDFGK